MRFSQATPIFDHIFAIFEWSKFFLKNQASSVFYLCCALTLYKQLAMTKLHYDYIYDYGHDYHLPINLSIYPSINQFWAEEKKNSQ